MEGTSLRDMCGTAELANLLVLVTARSDYSASRQDQRLAMPRAAVCCSVFHGENRLNVQFSLLRRLT
jgi:hypothetical protein